MFVNVVLHAVGSLPAVQRTFSSLGPGVIFASGPHQLLQGLAAALRSGPFDGLRIFDAFGFGGSHPLANPATFSSLRGHFAPGAFVEIGAVRTKGFNQQFTGGGFSGNGFSGGGAATARFVGEATGGFAGVAVGGFAGIARRNLANTLPLHALSATLGVPIRVMP